MKEYNKVVIKDFNEIWNIIKDNVELSFKNLVYLILYISIFLKDNVIVVVYNNIDYIEMIIIEYLSVKMIFDYYGVYVV